MEKKDKFFFKKKLEMMRVRETPNSLFGRGVAREEMEKMLCEKKKPKNPRTKMVRGRQPHNSLFRKGVACEK